MGNLWSFGEPPPPPPMVLVPPLFDFPPLAARTRMLESSYDLLFGKLALRCLFEDYFEEAKHFSTRIMLKPIDDPHVDLIATVAGPINHNPEEKIVGNAQFRWQRIFLMRSCAYYPKFGFGAFGIFPVLLKQRVSSEDYGVMGLRYGSSNLSVGATVIPFPAGDEFPRNAWLVSKMGRLTAGVQYEPKFGSKDGAGYKNLANWSCAIGYGLGSGSPLSPSFNFGLELAKNSQGKVGPLSSSIALAFKSWWKPAFTLSMSATRDRTTAETAYGFGIRVDNIREASYQRADPNFVMLTPNKEHLAEGIHWKSGKRPVLQSDVNSGNFDGVPKELRPLNKIL
ncbi:UNVERIFIED_CONTAM: hypothetical protein Sangu_1287100 [Sesamum angustifolium]|uniref:Uncharacterized protein n=1 Tax=Sesamum angustifolium TaxID=2727405 RepID=A0AAW2NJ05_9LAMI